MLERRETYDEVYGAFRWRIPARYNIGVDACDKWAGDADRLALIHEDESGRVETFTFARLKELSDRFANALGGLGVGRGDRVGILLAQGPETAIAHLAVYKLGAVAMPLFTLFGPDALAYRLENSGTRAVIGDAASLDKIAPLRDGLPALETLIAVGGTAGAADFHALIDKAASGFTPADTGADDPALISYTSGTTGPPKGALHAHRVLLGHLPGISLPHNFFPQPGDLMWTPADWAWIGGLMDALLPAWHFGVPVLAHRMAKFDPERAFALIARHGVRNAFMPPTALKLMRQVEGPRARHDLAMCSIGSGGESLGAELLDWGRETFDLTINEFYGQTEVNLVLGNCAEIMAVRPGAMGRPIPGHEVAVVDETGAPVATGETGQVAIKRPDPVMFLEYWRDAAATRAKFVGDWCLTGDLARIDGDGYYWFVGRDGRHHHIVGLPHRPGRDRGLPDEAPRRRHGGGDRRARRGAHRDRQGVRRGCARRDRRRRPGARHPGPCQDTARRPRIPTRGRVRARDAANLDRQDHAPRAARPRDRAPVGRGLGPVLDRCDRLTIQRQKNSRHHPVALQDVILDIANSPGRAGRLDLRPRLLELQQRRVGPKMMLDLVVGPAVENIAEIAAAVIVGGRQHLTSIIIPAARARIREHRKIRRTVARPYADKGLSVMDQLGKHQRYGHVGRSSRAEGQKKQRRHDKAVGHIRQIAAHQERPDIAVRDIKNVAELELVWLETLVAAPEAAAIPVPYRARNS